MIQFPLNELLSEEENFSVVRPKNLDNVKERIELVECELCIQGESGLTSRIPTGSFIWWLWQTLSHRSKSHATITGPT
jgi:hypothetical protein